MIKKNPALFRPRSLLALIVLVAACEGTGEQQTPGAAPAVSGPGAARMQEGLDLLYQRADPIAAERAFRDVLRENPAHYGAHFQLARAIDRSGRPAEARPLWQDVLRSAESINDTATASIA